MIEDIIKKFAWWNAPFRGFEVFPNLFQGSQIKTQEDIEKVRDLKIQTIIDLEGGFDPPMGFLDSYLYWPILDLPILPDIENLFCVAAFGAHKLNSQKKVLVHCKQGLNRSGLVCGRIMNVMGWRGPEILKVINEKIPGALWNPIFREFIRGL
jgi:protein-tyrosine phosphatase